MKTVLRIGNAAPFPEFQITPLPSSSAEFSISILVFIRRWKNNRNEYSPDRNLERIQS